MTLSDYIKVLQALETEHGEKEVCMTQSGYYADGNIADLFDEPEVKRVIILGHSHQSY